EHREAVPAAVSSVARLREEPAPESLDRGIGKTSSEELAGDNVGPGDAVDVHNLVHVAQSELAGGAQEEVTEVVVGAGAELTGVEVVVRSEAVLVVRNLTREAARIR